MQTISVENVIIWMYQRITDNLYHCNRKKEEYKMKTLVVYFSQTGKTKAVAERIAQLSSADLIEIKTHRSYQMSYRKTVFTSLKEILLKERPKLDMEIPDISAYDRILIGSPIWCGTLPNAVFSFLDKVDLNRKKGSSFYNQWSYRTAEDCGENQKEISCKMVQTI